MRTHRIACGLVLAAGFCGCAPHASPVAASPAPTPEVKPVSYEQEIRERHDHRMQRLQKPGGWLSLAGLSWLKDGANAVGSDSMAMVVWPSSAPKKVGTLTLATTAVTRWP